MEKCENLTKMINFAQEIGLGRKQRKEGRVRKNTEQGCGAAEERYQEIPRVRRPKNFTKGISV